MKEKEFNLIWVGDFDQEKQEYDLMNPKQLIGMNLDKALGSLKWSKRIIPTCKCFIYDPKEISIFNENGSQNIELIKGFIGDKLIEGKK